MLKALFLGLFAAAFLCGLASARPQESQPPLEDTAARSERSTNLSQHYGTARKIQMYVKNRYLQLLPDGTVNGTADKISVYSILQRTTVGIGKLKILGVATCQYLCMDSCGLLYGAFQRDFGDECIFNEMFEQHNYNTYSSARYSGEKRTMYLALNKRGQPRRVLLRARQQLGRLSAYTRVLTIRVNSDQHPMRHHAHLCSAAAAPRPTTEPPLCPRRKKRKRKRKCDEGDAECQKRQTMGAQAPPRRVAHKKCEFEDNVECQRVETVTIKKKLNKIKLGDKQMLNKKKKKLLQKGERRNKKVRTTTTSATTTEIMVTEDPTEDDYLVDSTTPWGDWDESSATPLLDDTGTTRPD